MTPHEMLLLGSASLLFIVLLFRFRRDDRPTLASTCVIGVIGLGLFELAGPAARGDLGMFAGVLAEAGLVTTGIAFIRLGGLFLFRLLLPVLRVVPPRIMEDVVVVAAYVGWAMSRLHHAGVNPGELVAASAVVTGIVAFAMQDTLGNILGGLALQMDNSIAIGDWIKVGDINGRVVDIRWRSMLIETRNWESVVVPNSVLMSVLAVPYVGYPLWAFWLGQILRVW